MARPKSKSASKAPAVEARLISSKRRLLPHGPLSASETEVIVYAGLKGGEVVATPDDFTSRAKPVQNLISDRPGVDANISCKQFHQVEDLNGLHCRLMRIHSSRSNAAANENQAAVAGSMDLVNQALKDAFKVVLYVEDGDENPPAEFAAWKAAKLDSKTTPPSITLVRFAS